MFLFGNFLRLVQYEVLRAAEDHEHEKLAQETQAQREKKEAAAERNREKREPTRMRKEEVWCACLKSSEQAAVHLAQGGGLLSLSLGLARSWLRRWRYRVFLRRASFQGEAVLLQLTNANVRHHIRHQLRDGWVREILRRRPVEAGKVVSDTLCKQVLAAPIETLIAANRSWYEPLMFGYAVAMIQQL